MKAKNNNCDIYFIFFSSLQPVVLELMDFLLFISVACWRFPYCQIHREVWMTTSFNYITNGKKSDNNNDMACFVNFFFWYTTYNWYPVSHLGIGRGMHSWFASCHGNWISLTLFPGSSCFLSQRRKVENLGNKVEIHSNNVVIWGLSLTLSTLSLKSMDDEYNDNDDDSYHENINVTIFPHNSALIQL